MFNDAAPMSGPVRPRFSSVEARRTPRINSATTTENGLLPKQFTVTRFGASGPPKLEAPTSGCKRINPNDDLLFAWPTSGFPGPTGHTTSATARIGRGPMCTRTSAPSPAIALARPIGEVLALSSWLHLSVGTPSTRVTAPSRGGSHTPDNQPGSVPTRPEWLHEPGRGPPFVPDHEDRRRRRHRPARVDRRWTSLESAGSIESPSTAVIHRSPGSGRILAEGKMGLGRLELPTSRLSGVRSNHLSYRPPLNVRDLEVEFQLFDSRHLAGAAARRRASRASLSRSSSGR